MVVYKAWDQSDLLRICPISEADNVRKMNMHWELGFRFKQEHTMRVGGKCP